jgi:hypothetical protein
VAMAGRTAGGGTIDSATIDTGTLARTVLVTRLLGQSTTVLGALDAVSIQEFKRSFNSGEILPPEALQMAFSVLAESVGRTALDGPYREVALRWLSGLCPLGPVIQAGPSTPP